MRMDAPAEEMGELIDTAGSNRLRWKYDALRVVICQEFT
jgi:hypothetical protein